MRKVTPAELALVGAALGGVDHRRVDRALPRRTRQTARRRLYLRDWLHDRYLPALGPLGSPILTFALARPYLESMAETVSAWQERPENLLLWAGPEAVFGVFASAERGPAEGLRAALARPSAHASEFLLAVDSRGPAVPIYFDFEGVWARALGGPPPTSYPQPFPTGGGTEEDGRALRAGERRAILRLLARPLRLPGDAAPTAGLFEASQERKCVASGRVRGRTFLDPGAVARWLPGFPDRLVLVSGALRGGRSPVELFRGLIAELDLRPFLFASDGVGVLVGLLASDRHEGDPVVARTVGEMLARHLTTIGIVREPLRQVTAIVNHRYDRPFVEAEPLPRGSDRPAPRGAGSTLAADGRWADAD